MKRPISTTEPYKHPMICTTKTQDTPMVDCSKQKLQFIVFSCSLVLCYHTNSLTSSHQLTSYCNTLYACCTVVQRAPLQSFVWFLMYSAPHCNPLYICCIVVQRAHCNPLYGCCCCTALSPSLSRFGLSRGFGLRSW